MPHLLFFFFSSSERPFLDMMRYRQVSEAAWRMERLTVVRKDPGPFLLTAQVVCRLDSFTSDDLKDELECRISDRLKPEGTIAP